MALVAAIRFPGIEAGAGGGEGIVSRNRSPDESSREWTRPVLRRALARWLWGAADLWLLMRLSKRLEMIGEEEEEEVEEETSPSITIKSEGAQEMGKMEKEEEQEEEEEEEE